MFINSWLVVKLVLKQGYDACLLKRHNCLLNNDSAAQGLSFHVTPCEMLGAVSPCYVNYCTDAYTNIHHHLIVVM